MSAAAAGKSSKQQRIAAAKEEAAKLKKQIEDRKAKLFTGSLKGLKHKPMPVSGLGLRKVLRGHYGKVYAVDWAGADDTLLSASQDGKLLVWNGPAGTKQQGTTSVKPEKELSHHEGYISCCKFIGPTQLVTASGDSTCVLWDIETATPKQVFADHGGDAMDAAVNPRDPNMFVSSSCDTTCKVWDIRSGKCTQTFVGHETDVNTVKFMGNGLAFGSGSDDSSCKLFDLRSYAQVNDFQDVTPGLSPGITSIDFSLSGRVLFAGYDDNSCKGWDTLEATAESPSFELDHHKNRVSTVALNRSGTALCLGSWDAELTIWA